MNTKQDIENMIKNHTTIGDYIKKKPYISVRPALVAKEGFEPPTQGL